MSREVLERVMGALSEGQLPNLKRVDLHNGGETLLHPDLPGMFTIIRRAKSRVAASTTFGLLTNGMLLTPKVSDQIIRSRAVDQIRFSLDGGTPELFESIRKGASWERVQSNIYSFLRANEDAGHPVRTEAICMLAPDHPSDTSFEPHFKTLLSMLDKVSLRQPHNWDGSVELEVDDGFYQEVAAKREGEVCYLLKNNLVVLPDGQVTVCCNDLNARGVIGSILEQDFKQLASTSQRLRMLRLFSESRKSAIPLCKECTGFYSHSGS